MFTFLQFILLLVYPGHHWLSLDFHPKDILSKIQENVSEFFFPPLYPRKKKGFLGSLAKFNVLSIVVVV